MLQCNSFVRMRSETVQMKHSRQHTCSSWVQFGSLHDCVNEFSSLTRKSCANVYTHYITNQLTHQIAKPDSSQQSAIWSGQSKSSSFSTEWTPGNSTAGRLHSLHIMTVFNWTVLEQRKQKLLFRSINLSKQIEHTLWRLPIRIGMIVWSSSRSIVACGNLHVDSSTVQLSQWT